MGPLQKLAVDKVMVKNGGRKGSRSIDAWGSCCLRRYVRASTLGTRMMAATACIDDGVVAVLRNRDMRGMLPCLAVPPQFYSESSEHSLIQTELVCNAVLLYLTFLTLFRQSQSGRTTRGQTEELSIMRLDMSRRNAVRATLSSGRPPATRSALERFPLEMWGTIFSLACVDNGYTGRSLSEVSTYINEASKSYKYQCIAVDHEQLRHLTAVLKKLAPNARCVRHLFISSIEHEGFFQADKNRLLITVAPTLRSLEIYFHHTSLALNFPLPSLVDFTLHGDMHMNKITPQTFACYPSLQRLHWVSAPRYHPRGFLILPLIQRTRKSLYWKVRRTCTATAKCTAESTAACTASAS